MIQLPIAATPAELLAVLNGAVERARAVGWTLAEESGSTDRTLVCPHGARLSVEAAENELSAALFARAQSFVGCSCSADVLSDIEGTPFTDSEMDVIRQRMPLTASAAEWLQEAAERPLEGLAAIFTIHHQRDFLVMLESAVALGLDPRHILVIDKEYEYLNRQRVDGHIRRALGAETATYSELPSSLNRFFDALHDRWQRAVLFDDGGYLLPRILEGPVGNREFVIGVVEQTSSGIVAIEPFAPQLKMPVFDVAESDLKQTVEARGVAAAGWRSLRNVLPDIHWNGRHALVCGYGRIGRALAQELARESVQVAVHDRDYAKLVTALEDGFAAFDSVSTAVARWQPDVLFGATGQKACWGREVFEFLERDCVMVSLTSRDYEFDKDYLAQSAAREEVLPGTGTRYVLATGSAMRSVLLVADGYPINFYRAESMPNEQSDLILAAMLLGGVEIVRQRAQFGPGVNRDRSNEIINRHDILRRYYEARRAQLVF